MTEQLTAWVRDVLGCHSEVERLPLNNRKRAKGHQVRAVVDARGKRWILKEVAVAGEWEAETHAFAHWVPALAERAPTLHGADADLRALVMSEVRGRHPRATHEGFTRQAGALLRQFHDAALARSRPAARTERAAARLGRLLIESQPVLGPDQLGFAREHGDRLAQIPLPEVPCHGDFRPHNWLVDDSRTLRVIDFGKSRWEVAAWDLAKLFLRPWWHRPHLAAAFLEGYGRGLLAAEVEYLKSRMALDALSHTAFGASRGSDRHVRFGRDRLCELMAGHAVVPRALHCS